MNGYAGRSLYSFGSKQGPTIKSCGGVLSGPKLISFKPEIKANFLKPPE